MAHSSNAYQRVYLRIYRASDQEKDRLRSLLHEVLKLNFETAKFVDDYKRAEHTQKAVPVDATFKLGAAETKPVLTKISPSIVGVSSGVTVETYTVTVPEKNQLEMIIPFYRDILLEFFNEHKHNVKLNVLEDLVKKYQTFSLEQLRHEKDKLTKAKEELIYTRILQESYKAHSHSRETLNLFSEDPTEKQPIDYYRETPEKQRAFTVLTMLNLKKEGFGYLESALAVNRLIKKPLLIEEQDPTRTPTYEVIIDTYHMEEAEELELWEDRENRKDGRHKHLIYVKQREKEILEEKAHRNWLDALRKELIAAIQSGASRDDVFYDYTTRNISQKAVNEVMRVYDQLIEEGYMMRLKVRTVKGDPQIIYEKMEEKIENTNQRTTHGPGFTWLPKQSR